MYITFVKLFFVVLVLLTSSLFSAQSSKAATTSVNLETSKTRIAHAAEDIQRLLQDYRKKSIALGMGITTVFNLRSIVVIQNNEILVAYGEGNCKKMDSLLEYYISGREKMNNLSNDLAGTYFDTGILYNDIKNSIQMFEIEMAFLKKNMNTNDVSNIESTYRGSYSRALTILEDLGSQLKEASYNLSTLADRIEKTDTLIGTMSCGK